MHGTVMLSPQDVCRAKDHPKTTRSHANSRKKEKEIHGNICEPQETDFLRRPAVYIQLGSVTGSALCMYT